MKLRDSYFLLTARGAVDLIYYIYNISGAFEKGKQAGSTSKQRLSRGEASGVYRM